MIMLDKNFTQEDSITCPFKEVDGLYLSILLGGPLLHTGSFGKIYKSALSSLLSCPGSLEAKQTLQTPVYPYNLNALHYFAVTHNAEGVL